MYSSPAPKRPRKGFAQLFEGDVESPLDRALLWVCNTTGVVAVTILSTQSLTDYAHSLFAKVVIKIGEICIPIFLLAFCWLGIRSIGRAAGKHSFISQAVYVLKRMSLYVVLPAAVITAVIVLVATSTGQLHP